MRGRPTIDLLFSIRFGTSQFRLFVVDVNERFHLGAACRPRRNCVVGDVCRLVSSSKRGLASEMSERAEDIFRRRPRHFIDRFKGSKVQLAITLSMVKM